ncbi:MAG: branched-chain amino acid aminotransferase [Actinobacteria bacterium]|nr:branched-chain amino acid aminotransferase [Actinomycetota bacterium]
MDEKVFLNGELIPASEAKVSVFDGGFLHGAGLFETMRAYAGKVYRLDEHLDRLLNSANKLAIPVAGNKDDLHDAVVQTLEANGLDEARLRLTVSWGDLRSDPKGTTLITASQLQPYPADFYKKGLAIVISDSKVNSSDPVARHKSTNYLARLLVLRKAQQLKAGEALWFSESNHLAEGCISNVFLVKDNKLLTPSLAEPILPGVTRAAVLELAKAEKIPVSEQSLTIDEVLAAEEIFLTNSIMEIMPVCRVEKHAVGNEGPGPITKQLAQLYQQDVEQKCK